MKKIQVLECDLLDLIHYARRYCDSRSTYAPREFNKIYIRIKLAYPNFIRKDEFDNTLKDSGTYWPYAQDGMFNKEKDAFNALQEDKYEN
jgi:hypothetical protein